MFGKFFESVWSCYANFQLLSLEIGLFGNLYTRKYFHSMTKLPGWLRHGKSLNDTISSYLRMK